MRTRTSTAPTRGSRSVRHDRSPKPALAAFEAIVDASPLLPDAIFSRR